MTYLPVDSDGRVRMEDLEAAMTDKTVLVSAQDIQNHLADDYVCSLFSATQQEEQASAAEVIERYRCLSADEKARIKEYLEQGGSEG